MIGPTKMTLSEDSVREALEEYINRHLLESKQVKVTKWEIPNTYTHEVLVVLEPVGKDERPTPFPLDPVHD